MTTSHISLSRLLVRRLLQRRAAITADARRRCALRIADCVGIAHAAAGGQTARQVLAALAEGSSGGRCGVLGGRRREAPATAAFANSALVHVLDFDDIHDAARLHPTTLSFPAALAAAQLVNSPASHVLEAVLLGDELMCRLGVACAPQGSGPGSDWFLTQLFGYFGAALAAGTVLQLEEEQLVSAFGLAYMQAAGGKEAGFGVGATARAIYPAFGAMGGMQACLLARAGIRGPEGAFDGAAGLFPVYLGMAPTPAQVGLLLATGGWQADAIQLKPWPCCRLSHPYVAAALALREATHGATPVRIEAQVNASAAKLCRPLEQRRRPATLQDAKYSIPWMIAFSLIHGRVDLATLNEAALSDERVSALAERVEIADNLPDGPGHPPARICIQTADGRDWHSPDPSTLPVDDMDLEGTHAKFGQCLQHAGFAPAQRESLWTRLLHLDQEPSVDFLFETA